jgi:hypothetical protein
VNDPNPPKDQQCPSPGDLTDREQVADLSTLDDEGIVTEGKREVVRRTRIENMVTKEAAEQDRSNRSVDRRERTILLGLLIFVVLLIAAVVVVRLSEKNDELARPELVALAGAFWSVLYRLRSLDKR